MGYSSFLQLHENARSNCLKLLWVLSIQGRSQLFFFCFFILMEKETLKRVALKSLSQATGRLWDSLPSGLWSCQCCSASHTKRSSGFKRRAWSSSWRMRSCPFFLFWRGKGWVMSGSFDVEPAPATSGGFYWVGSIKSVQIKWTILLLSPSGGVFIFFIRGQLWYSWSILGLSG